MCIELDYGECDQDDRDDDAQGVRGGVVLEEVDMVVMMITADEDVRREVPIRVATLYFLRCASWPDCGYW